MPKDSEHSLTPGEYAPPKSEIIVPALTLGRLLGRFVVIAVAIALALFVALILGILTGLMPFNC